MQERFGIRYVNRLLNPESNGSLSSSSRKSSVSWAHRWARSLASRSAKAASTSDAPTCSHAGGCCRLATTDPTAIEPLAERCVVARPRYVRSAAAGLRCDRGRGVRQGLRRNNLRVLPLVRDRRLLARVRRAAMSLIEHIQTDATRSLPPGSRSTRAAQTLIVVAAGALALGTTNAESVPLPARAVDCVDVDAERNHVRDPHGPGSRRRARRAGHGAASPDGPDMGEAGRDFRRGSSLGALLGEWAVDERRQSRQAGEIMALVRRLREDSQAVRSWLLSPDASARLPFDLLRDGRCDECRTPRHASGRAVPTPQGRARGPAGTCAAPPGGVGGSLGATGCIARAANFARQSP